MRRVVLSAAGAVLLGAPVVLAFFAGGYFDRPRMVATITVWAVVLVVAVASPQPVPRSRCGRAALAGLALIALWSGLSIVWAPDSQPATAATVRVLMYTGALVAASALMRDRFFARAVEPALALGAFIVIGYGLLGRLLPGLLELSRSSGAGDRLEQPLTYWNATGALAAAGLVLSVRLAGEGSRPVAIRATAAGASTTLVVGLYLSYSRGAVAAAAVGLVVLLALVPRKPQLRALALAVGAGILVSAVATALPAVASLEGSAARRDQQGAAVLALLVAVTAAVVLTTVAFVRAESKGRSSTGRMPGSRRMPALAVGCAVLALGGLVAGGLAERGSGRELAQRKGASRLTTVRSLRYDYWRVGLRAVGDSPLRGVGAAGFRSLWFRDRPVAEPVSEIHSLPLEMLVELGAPGVIGFGLLVGGVALCGRRALRQGAEPAAGAAAAAVVWLVHSSIDWDWQLPAVGLQMLILAGVLVAAADSRALSVTAPRAGSAA